MDLDGIIQIGTVIKPHGIKGELKVLAQTNDPAIFLELDRLILIQEGKRKMYTLAGAREDRKNWLLRLKEVTDMTAAQQLKGAALFTEEENVRPLAEDEFFIHDLIDAKVYSTTNQYLGVIVNYFEVGTQGICEVKTECDSFLFPTSHEVLIDVIPSDKVVINLIPELRDLNKR
jgi:16S rRNA processing protein RimM